MQDVLLVGLGIGTLQDYEELIPDKQLHVGVSILDTLCLHSLLVSLAEEVATATNSHLFTLGTTAY